MQVRVQAVSPGDWAALQWHVEESRTVEINVRSTDATSTPRITLIVDGEHVVALGRVRRISSSGTLDTRLRLSDIELANPPVAIDEIVARVNQHVRHNVRDKIRAGGEVAKRSSEELLTALFAINPETKTAIERLQALQPSSRPANERARLRAEQRDALALGLEVAGIDSADVMPFWEGAGDDLDAPFLAGFGGLRSSEASIIRHDHNHFDDWIPGEGRVLDVMEFRDPADRARKVTVAYVDKERAETATGTDLIYYRHHLPGYVLVQYKRMTKVKNASGGTRHSYFPDTQLAVEIARMKKLLTPGPPPTGLENWRLSSAPFYIKLCEEDMVRPEAHRLVRGMYFPLALFEELLESPLVVGPRGGKRIGWDNAQRYLTNTDFTELVKHGWIGSSGTATTDISAILQNSLGLGRGVVVVRDDTEVEHARPLRRGGRQKR